MPGPPRRTYPDGTKECVKCHAILPLSQFCVRKDRIGQWKPRCKECTNAPKRTGPRQYPPIPDHKICASCGRHLPITHYYPRPGRRKGAGKQSHCKDCVREKHLGRKRPGRKPPTPEQIWGKNVRRKGLTPDAWRLLLAQQNGLCACCAGPSNGKGRFHVDHDHATGDIRGLLCHKCNTALGLLNEDSAMIEKAISYLLHHFKKSP